MSSAAPAADLQVQAPAPQQPAPQQAAPQAQPAPKEEPGPSEDVILKPEQVENLLRGLPAEGVPESEPPPETPDAEQTKMAQDFFSQVLPEPSQVVPGQAPPGEPPTASPIVQAAQAQVAQVAEPVQLPPVQQVPLAAPQQVPGQPPAVPGQMPAAVPVQQPSPEMAALMAQNATLGQELQSIKTQMAQMQGQAPAPPSGVQPPAGQEAQAYNFRVPDQYLAALASEDAEQRRGALNGLLNGVANSVAQSLRAEMQQQMQTVPDMITSQSAHYAQQQEINRDMYGMYPELAQYRHLVGPTAMAVARETQAQSWTPQLRDEVARRLAPMVPGLFPRVQQNLAAQAAALPQAGQVAQIPQHYAAVQAVPAVQQVAAPPTMLARDAQGNLIPIYQPPQPYQGPGGTRPDGSVGGSRELQDIWRTLDYA